MQLNTLYNQYIYNHFPIAKNVPYTNQAFMQKQTNNQQQHYHLYGQQHPKVLHSLDQ